MLHNHKLNLVTVFFCSLLWILMTPSLVFANTDSEEKGKIKWDIDRIMKGNSEEEGEQRETEKEKLFPDLFQLETFETIHTVQKENNESMQALQDSLFSLEIEENKLIEDTKTSLFTSDYVTPKKSSSSDMLDDNESSWFNNIIMAGLAGIGVLIVGGIFLMFRQLSD